MFCSYCGTESTQGLNYCNRCGGSLSAVTTAGAQEMRPAISTGTAWAAGATTAMLALVGFGILLGALTDLAHSGLPPGTISGIMVTGALMIFGCVALLMRFWMRLLVGKRQPGVASFIAARHSSTGELNPAPARVSALPDPPFSSVTEHTTRTLEHLKK